MTRLPRKFGTGKGVFIFVSRYREARNNCLRRTVGAVVNGSMVVVNFANAPLLRARGGSA